VPAASVEGHCLLHFVVTALCYVILPDQNLGRISDYVELCGQISKSPLPFAAGCKLHCCPLQPPVTSLCCTSLSVLFPTFDIYSLS
jgi:hypothetical protein